MTAMQAAQSEHLFIFDPEKLLSNASFRQDDKKSQNKKATHCGALAIKQN